MPQKKQVDDLADGEVQSAAPESGDLADGEVAAPGKGAAQRMLEGFTGRVNNILGGQFQGYKTGGILNESGDPRQTVNQTFNPFHPLQTAGYLVPQPIKDIVAKWTSGDKAGAIGDAAALSSQATPVALKHAGVHPVGAAGQMVKEVGISALEDSDKIRGAVQASENVGKQFTREHLERAEEQHQQRLKDTSEKNQKAVAENEKQWQDIAEKNRQAQAEAASEYRDSVERVGKKNKAVLDKYQSEKAKIDNDNREGAEKVAKRQQLEQQVEQQSKALQDGIRQADKDARKVGNEKYNTVRQAVKDSTAPPEPIANAVRHAQKEILKGSPENIKQFNELLKREGDEAGPLAIDGKEIAPDEPGYQIIKDAYTESGLLHLDKPLTFDDLKGY